MKRRIAFSVVSIRQTSGLPPAGGRTAATIESLCTSSATHRRTSVGAIELTSGTGWSSTQVVCGSGRSGPQHRTSQPATDATREGQPPHASILTRVLARMAVPLFDTQTPLAPLREAMAAKAAEVLEAGRYILGPEVSAFERELGERLGAPHVLGVANGTDALVLALRAMGVGPGDDVVVPSFTFYASAEAIAVIGANPVFCDIDPATFCVTPETVKAALTPHTKVVMAVHLFGNVAPIEELEALGVPVLEDAAQALGSRAAGGRMAGTLGTAATF